MHRLNYNNWNIDLLCERGGALACAEWNGIDVLRTGQGPDARDTAAFPLFPFSGRINQGQFNWAGRTYALAPNMAPEPHAIHGQGWQDAWRIAETSAAAARIEYNHKGDVWPWPYRAEQSFDLDDGRLVWTGRLTNVADTPMPAGFGWHPYFPRKGATILARVSAVWRSGADMIPHAPEPLGPMGRLLMGVSADDLPLDFAFVRNMTEVDLPVATLTYPTHRVNIYADPIFTNLVIYTPPNENFFCVEPVSHAPDAVNSPLPCNVTGLISLDAKAQLKGSISLEVLPL